MARLPCVGLHASDPVLKYLLWDWREMTGSESFIHAHMCIESESDVFAKYVVTHKGNLSPVVNDWCIECSKKYNLYDAIQ